MTDAKQDPPAPEDLARRLLQLEKALDTMQVGVTITDCARRILYANRAEAELHGYAKEELLGRDAAELFAPDGAERLPLSRDELRQLKSWRRESLNRRRDGTSFPVEILSDVVLDRDGEPMGIVSICQDVTARKVAERALAKSEERYSLALAGANDGLWDWDLDGERIFFSERWKRMLGYEEADIGDHPDNWFALVHLEDLDALKREIDQHLAGASDHFHSEHRMLHHDGTYHWMLARGVAVRADGRAVRMAGSQTDITDRKVHDPLTGLPNRALFLDRLDNALRRSRRKMSRQNAVLFLDLDRFKVVNDSLGHLAGDQLLIQVARALESTLRPGDTVARLGGDEFTVLLEDIHEVEDAVHIAERIHASLADPFQIGDQEVFTSVSIGIALSATGMECAADLLRDADTAMYRAKAQGTGRHQLFDRDMRDRAVAQLKLETDLRRALDRGEFELHYQPILDLDRDRVVGLEALLRWNHPQRGLLGPYQFIPVAEETGLILPIGRWVLAEACRRLKNWQRRFAGTERLTVSVNLSPKQFNHPRLVNQVREVLAQTGLAPASLQLEITESAFIDNVEGAVQMLDNLRRMGVEVAIDDFGTGYSSLAYLNRFPVDSLKIDRSFIRQLGPRGKQNELVKTIIRMAANLGIDVVAEGVETVEQQEHLRSLKCGFLQGFTFSQAVPAAEFEQRFLQPTDVPS